ncbi:MAG: hypothetical protein ACXADY_06130 [Candidatus Hodarchaeales archaeon]
MNPTHPPYPYHPIATSLHYLVLYIFISVLFPSKLAMILSIFIVQFSVSLITLYLLYNFFLESFHLDIRQSLVLVVFYDFIFISPYLLLAASEILYLFYQILAWTYLLRRQYFFAAIATAMTFALRFNGVFFVVGVVLVFFLKWWKTKDKSLKFLIKVGLTGIPMFIVGFSSFILSLLFSGDFWLPLTTQVVKYQTRQEYAAEGALSLPFLWWPTYLQYVILSNSLIESIYFMMAIIALVLGFFSLYALLKWSRQDNTEHPYSLSILFVCGFLGVNTVVSGSNFARFLSYTFPVFPVIPLLLRSYDLSSRNLLILLIGSGIWGLLYNIIWWMSYPV